MSISREEKEKFKELIKSGGKPYASAYGEYGGGHPELDRNCSGTITVNRLGVFFSSLYGQFFIPVENITKAEYKNEEQISKDVTLTRLLAFGIFAFGLKKKRKDETFYYVLSYKEKGIDNTIVFKVSKVLGMNMAGSLASGTIKARQEYINEHPEALEPQGNVSNTADIPEQIRKLSELKDQGILTEQEFEYKKKELLAKM